MIEAGEEEIAGKECLKCAEIIKVRAKVCRHCGYEHTEEELAAQQKALEDKRRLEEENHKREEERIEQERIEKEENERRKAEEKKLKTDGIKYKNYRILMNDNSNYIVTLTDSLWDKAPVKGSSEYPSLERAKAYIDAIDY